ncbi:MAG: HsdR family type I site-specific deoxyribonuclease [Bacteroidetes bacterium]|jgi:type I restriction enzyme R subunit|nr:HsdR family type I site-specific deoxyribonuclease [Bacteroidota bacterium]
MELLHPSENLFEQTTIDRLQAQGYTHHAGQELRQDPAFGPREVVHRPVLRAFLQRQYPTLPGQALDQAVAKIANPEGVDLAQRNKHFHELLTRGFELRYEDDAGELQTTYLYPIAWDAPESNDFWVVDQLSIEGNTPRRPDLILYVNGLPLVVFELKNPYNERTTVGDAYNQMQHYTQHLPRLFNYNAFCVISDGTTTQHGVHSAGKEWFAPWKSIDGVQVVNDEAGSMKTLVEGLLAKERLLAYIRHFIVHEQTGHGIVKKGAKYHQFFGVQQAAEQTLRATRPDGDRRIGVIWHTQGSGKSLSMVFLVGILRRAMDNPTIVIEVDRTDLDEQLYDSFVAARQLVGPVHHADAVADLRRLLDTEGGEVIFTTVEKFRLQEAEREHPVLSERRNVVVIADEAHRTQYGLQGKLRYDEATGDYLMKYGFARYLRQALPNASFIGFTGTPISEADRDTVAVFGDLIHTYDLTQAQKDGAIVPIHYEARLIDLELQRFDLDEELEAITEGADVEQEKAKWTTVESAAGTPQRLQKLAQDVSAHFRKRTEHLFGKGMIVGMSRRNCVGIYEAITDLHPDWHHADLDKGKIKVVMTGDLSKDPVAWSEAGHITSKAQRDQLKERFRDPDDPLHLVIVCDMWLTGTDIPCLHTLYVDKPMKGHTLMQAIARVNRVFRDKGAGLVVDYIGISTALKEATRKYTDTGSGPPTEAIDEQAWATFEDALKAMRASLPEGVDVRDWRSMDKVAFDDLMSQLYNHYASDEHHDDFLKNERRLSKAYSLVGHLDKAAAYNDEVALYQIIRKQLTRLEDQERAEATAEYEEAVRDLIDSSLKAHEPVDIYEAAGLDKPEISILDEAFLEEFSTKKNENLRVKALEKLMKDQIRAHERKNPVQARSFQEMLEQALKRYREGAITAAEVVQAMVHIKQEADATEARQDELGLSEEEMAFYSAIEGLEGQTYDMPFLCDLVREIVGVVKNNLEVDWTKPHRENVKASVKSAVKMVLRRRGIGAEHFQFILSRVMEQAETRYREWPKAG